MEKESLKLVGVRFQQAGGIYDFDCGHFVLNCGDLVIVKTEQGTGLGRSFEVRRRLHRTPEGKEIKKRYSAWPMKLIWICTGSSRKERRTPFPLFRVANRGKKSGHEIGKRRYVFLMEVKSSFSSLRPKDESTFGDSSKTWSIAFIPGLKCVRSGLEIRLKMLGGLGHCGREVCCSTFLPDFATVSVKMAKEQNLPLNPIKISGLCGRLMCCLTYEFDPHLELKKDFPNGGEKPL